MVPVLSLLRRYDCLSPSAIARDLEAEFPEIAALFREDRKFLHNVGNKLRRMRLIGGGNRTWAITSLGMQYLSTHPAH